MGYEELYISTVFIAGFISFFAPCIISILPIYVGILADESHKRYNFKFGNKEINVTRLIKAMVFIVGLGTAFVILGFGAGAIGAFIYSQTFLVIIGGIVIILGIHQTGLIKLKFLEKQKKLELKRSRRNDIVGTYLLGLTFSFGWTPCVGPILGAVLGISASRDNAFYGAWLMLVYTIGLMIPFLIVALFSELLLEKVNKINKHLGKIKVVGGILIILMGILLMTNQLTALTVFIENFIN